MGLTNSGQLTLIDTKTTGKLNVSLASRKFHSVAERLFICNHFKQKYDYLKCRKQHWLHRKKFL